MRIKELSFIQMDRAILSAIKWPFMVCFFVGYSSLTVAAIEQPGDAELIRALDAIREIRGLSDKATFFGPDRSEEDKLASRELARLGATYSDSLRKASSLGNPVAKYYLSSYVVVESLDHVRGKAESCKFLDDAADSGLLAAAVSHIYKCDEGFKRWHHDDEEHLKLINRLKEELAVGDKNLDWYPLPIMMGLCSPPPPMIEIKGLPFPMLGAKLATYDEFKAEANMIIATADPRISVEEQKIHLQKAASLQCRYASNLIEQ